MTQERINYIVQTADEFTKELWGTDHLSCYGNLTIKLQQLVEKVITETEQE